SGFHLDSISKRIDIWHAAVHTNIAERLKEKWPSWELHEHYDQYEGQFEKLTGRLQYQAVDCEILLLEIKSLLLRAPFDPLNNFSSLIRRLQQEGKEVEVSSFAFMHGEYNLPMNTREEIIQYAISVLQNNVKQLER
ncbi:MAG: hypothetical protein K0R67_2325, partial [Paenibacillus sp.]|nr:hypothetical protein [Paenibacillus sp.]